MWPQEFGGPSVPGNMRRVCCNAHSDIHYHLNYLLKYGNGKLPAEIARTFNHYVQQISRQGYELISEHAPHLLPSLQLIAVARLEEAPTEVHQHAWRQFSEAYRGCPFGSHAPGEPHHYSCHLLED